MHVLIFVNILFRAAKEEFYLNTVQVPLKENDVDAVKLKNT